MNGMLALAGPMGFVASEKSLCDELDVAARRCAGAGLALAVSSAEATQQCAMLHGANPHLILIADTRHWARHFASPQQPSEVSSQLIDLDMWTDCALQASGARSVLAPTGYIRLGDAAALAAVVAELDQAGHPGLVGFVATDAETLTPRYLPMFLEALDQSTSPPRVPLRRQRNPSQSTRA